jgi:hypothetical protein
LEFKGGQCHEQCAPGQGGLEFKGTVSRAVRPRQGGLEFKGDSVTSSAPQARRVGI